ncbi:protein of unknown function [Streptomyces murinus]
MPWGPWVLAMSRDLSEDGPGHPSGGPPGQTGTPFAHLPAYSHPQRHAFAKVLHREPLTYLPVATNGTYGCPKQRIREV